MVKRAKQLNKPVDKWVWHQFVNPARNEGDGPKALKLSHWTKENEVEEVYPFARFNRKPDIIQYTDQEYKEFIENSPLGLGGE